MNERIRLVRQYLKLTQEDFANLLKLQRNTITLVENGKRNLSSRTIDYLCDKCNINKEWLMFGYGSMLKDTTSFSLEEYAHKNQLSADEIEIIKCYIELAPNIRHALIFHFKNYFSMQTKNNPGGGQQT